MKLAINGEAREIPGTSLTLEEILQYLGIATEQGGIAVAVNLNVVRRSDWEKTQIEEQDEIEIIVARQGG